MTFDHLILMFCCRQKTMNFRIQMVLQHENKVSLISPIPVQKRRPSGNKVGRASPSLIPVQKRRKRENRNRKDSLAGPLIPVQKRRQGVKKVGKDSLDIASLIRKMR